MRTTLALACLCSLSLAASAATSGSSAGGVSATGNPPSPSRTVNPPVVAVGKHKVNPGQSCTNGDGVTVNNGTDSNGNATIDPKHGNGSSSTTVDTKTGFQGEISGLDNNDVVNLGSSNTVTISGTGGTVNMSGGSTITVSATGGGGITVNLSSGQSVTVPAGAQGVVINS